MIHLVSGDGTRERLRWTDQHGASRFGLGVVLRGNTGETLSGLEFLQLVRAGVRIECGSDLERRRTAGALGLAMLGEAVEAITLSPGGTMYDDVAVQVRRNLVEQTLVALDAAPSGNQYGFLSEIRDRIKKEAIEGKPGNAPTETTRNAGLDVVSVLNKALIDTKGRPEARPVNWVRMQLKSQLEKLPSAE